MEYIYYVVMIAGGKNMVNYQIIPDILFPFDSGEPDDNDE